MTVKYTERMGPPVCCQLCGKAVRKVVDVDVDGTVYTTCCPRHFRTSKGEWVTGPTAVEVVRIWHGPSSHMRRSPEGKA